MENTHKQLVALNSDSIRHLVNEINERCITKDDVLDLICENNSYYLLYYEDID